MGLSPEDEKNWAESRIVIGPGAKPPLFFAGMCLLQPGDEILIPDPGFPAYKALAMACSCSYKFVPMNEACNSFNMEKFKAALTDKTKLVIINSPSNPTGGVMPKKDLDEVMALVKDKPKCWVLSDEIYSQLCYDGIEVPSALSYPDMRDRTIAVDGFSKTYCMTGWRLGWAVLPPNLQQRVHLFMTHSIGCSASFTQMAGVAALQGDQTKLTEMVEDYKKRRDYIVGALNDMPGVSCESPQGAFYVFPNISKLFGTHIKSSKEFADKFLDDKYIVCLPGTDFGEAGEGHLRFSYVRNMEELKRGMTQMAEFVNEIVQKDETLKLGEPEPEIEQATQK